MAASNNKLLEDRLFDAFNYVIDIKPDVEENVYNSLSQEQQHRLDKTNNYIKKIKTGIMTMYMTHDDETAESDEYYDYLLKEALDSLSKCIDDRD